MEQNKFSLAMKMLAAALAPAYYQDGHTPKGRNEEASKRQKTKKGAAHIHRPTFKSRNLLDITPAQYRAQHLGVLKGVIPNHLKQHAAPRGRNVWMS